MSLGCIARQISCSARRVNVFTAARQVRRVVSRPQAAPMTWRLPQLSASFSTSRMARQGDAGNQELVAKLNSEIALEKEQQDDDGFRSNIKEYLDNSDFSIHDTPGQEEVHLTRTYGDEQIKVTFSIADFNTMDPEADEAEDPALYDEDDNPMDMDGQSGGANTKGAVGQGRTAGGNVRMAPEGDVTPADRPELRDEEDEEEPHPSFPARVQVNVTRPGKGAISFECLVQDGEMTVENVYHFPSAEMAEAKSAEQEWARRSIYTGPPFAQLDEDLQVLLERYLDERGINTTMALFIPDYIDVKEQQEYVRWLDNMKSFVD